MKLKICGMKYKDNIQAVAQLQPHYLGFIFYEKSARYFNGKLPDISSDIKKTGVFVDETKDGIVSKINQYNLNVIQLHGNETPEFCSQLKETFNTDFKNKIEIIKVFSIKNHFNFEVLKPYETVCDYYLFDTKGKLPGGNGYKFNWEILNAYSSTKPYFLSGGIGVNEIETINNFKQSSASKYCYAIDVNSKFEIEPGLKNIKTLEHFKNTMHQVLQK